MIELSRRFLWVKVDRDVTPKVPNRFSVRAYPTLIAMTPKAEKIHRWRGFGGLEKWMPDYQEALRRTELWAAGEEWLSEPTRPEKLCDVGELSSIPAPKEDHVWAMAFVGERLFVVQGMGRFKLHRIDAKTGQVEATLAIPDSISDLTSDGTHLYAVSSSWSKGDPVRVLDPSTGKVIREIASSRNPGKRGSFSHGIAWCNGSLLIGSDSEIYTLNPETGECSPPQRTGVYRVTNMTFEAPVISTSASGQSPEAATMARTATRPAGAPAPLKSSKP